MLKIASTPQIQEEFREADVLWISPDGYQFRQTKYGIVMRTNIDMFIVTQNEFDAMKAAGQIDRHTRESFFG